MYMHQTIYILYKVSALKDVENTSGHSKTLALGS